MVIIAITSVRKACRTCEVTSSTSRVCCGVSGCLNRDETPEVKLGIIHENGSEFSPAIGWRALQGGARVGKLRQTPDGWMNGW